MITKRPRGTADATPTDTPKWQYLESVAREICRCYGYGEIRTPVFEHTELFQRTVGEFTDVVEKEMYTFEDRGGRSLTLRPEGTAAAGRLFLEAHLDAAALPAKLYYLSWPIFRYERPQAGRLRQHHQFGVECFGSADPLVDAEIITMAQDFLSAVGLADLRVGLNSMGCPECRHAYRAALREHYGPRREKLCPDCQRRYEQNPLRLLDCKVETCQELKSGLPPMGDFLCPACQEHLKKVEGYLHELGIRYHRDPSLVRGFDYYTRTVFEISHQALGAQDVVCGGGRYDGLVESLGGDPTPGVGFGLGLERLLLILEEEGVSLPSAPPLDVFVVTIGEEVRSTAFGLVQAYRRNGWRADLDVMDRSMRAQMRFADKYPARYVLILGPDELAGQQVPIRNMVSGTEEKVALKDAVGYLAEQSRVGT